MTDGKWLIELRSIESDYNKKRWDFRNKFKRYIRNNPYSDSYSEEELIEDLKELGDIRNKMKEISHDNNFKSEKEHLYRFDQDKYYSRAAKPIPYER